MLNMLTDRSRLVFVGVFPPTTQLVHHGWYPLKLPLCLFQVATKGVVVSEELETSKTGVDLGRYVSIECNFEALG